jgi:hypothetical protein
VKKKVSVTIHPNIAQKCKDLGINMSKVSENALISVIDAIENRKAFLSPGSSSEESGVRSPGFEPGIISLEGLNRCFVDGTYREWLKKRKFVAGWESIVFSYSVQFGECLIKRDLSRVRDLPDSQRPNVLKALSSLSKYLGVSEDYKVLRKNFGLKWVGRNSDDIIIDRLTSVKDPDEIWRWVIQVKEARQDLTCFIDYLSVTGLRFIEAVNSYNLIIQLSREGKLDLVLEDGRPDRYVSGYYNRANSALEHFRFKSIFLRPTKKAFVSFVPPDLISEVGKLTPLPRPGAVGKLVSKRGLLQRFSDVREQQGTFMTKWLKPEEVDFLQGRMKLTTFMKHYFNPSTIADLRTRVFQGITEIQEKIKS